MPLTHTETGRAGRDIFPMEIARSSLIETSCSSTGAVAEECTIALGFKPTAATSPPLNDMTGHYLLTIRKQGGSVTVWKQGVELDAYPGDVGATYAEFVQNVLAHYAGSPHGYYSRLVIVEAALDYSPFWTVSESVTGLWVPTILPGLAIHTLLDFSDAADPGRDSSGNANDWTVNGSPAQTGDTPTNNHCTLNALVPSGSTLSNGNLTAETPLSGDSDVTATFRVPDSGKWAWEVTFDSGSGFFCGGTYDNGDHFRVYSTPSPQRVQWSITGAPGSSFDLSGFAVGNTATFEFDADNGALYLRIDGVPENGGNPIITGMPGDFLPVVGDGGGPEACGVTCRFGAQGLSQTVSPGFRALCSANLPDPAILRSDTVADVVLREGTGTAASVTSLGFTPDKVVTKARDYASSWGVIDAKRGDEKAIFYDLANAENAEGGSLSIMENGFGLGANGIWNRSGCSFMDLCLKAGAGQGFEIVTYTGTGVARAIPHSLGKAPTFIIVKNLDSLEIWCAYHAALGAAKALYFSTAAAYTNAAYWNNTEPMSTQFHVGTGITNLAGDRYIAYLFTDSDIFKAFSYTGNGSADGPFRNVGGKIKAILFLKNTDQGATFNWGAFDDVRSRSNPVDACLYPNLSGVENYQPYFTMTSQGFKVSDGGELFNGSGDTMIGLALLEAAAKYANAF